MEEAPVKHFESTVAMLEGYTWRPWQNGQPVLYHYTDAPGLMGIVSSRSIRLSDSRHLNDQREQLETRDATKEVVEWHVKRFPSEPARLARALLSTFQQTDDLKLSRSGLLFVACFSVDSDSLSQWRSYGRGEGGFAIGFKASALWRLAQTELIGEGFRLMPCNYDVGQYRVALDQVLNLAEAEFVSLAASQGDAFALSQFVQRVAWYGSALKNEAFSSEREWRLIYHRIPALRPDVAVRHLPSKTFKPFVELQLGSTPDFISSIHEIVIGPQRHMDLAREGLLSFIHSELSGEVPIRISSVPFRAMD